MDPFEKLKEIIFKDVPAGIEVQKYCEHQKQFITLRDNPSVDSCQVCMDEIKSKYLKNEKK